MKKYIFCLLLFFVTAKIKSSEDIFSDYNNNRAKNYYMVTGALFVLSMKSIYTPFFPPSNNKYLKKKLNCNVDVRNFLMDYGVALISMYVGCFGVFGLVKDASNIEKNYKNKYEK